jgi:hypothetical protein
MLALHTQCCSGILHIFIVQILPLLSVRSLQFSNHAYTDIVYTIIMMTVISKKIARAVLLCCIILHMSSTAQE